MSRKIRADNKTLKRIAAVAAAVLLTAAVAALLAWGGWILCFRTPCRVELDCRGYGTDNVRLEELMEREAERSGGLILDMVGWKIREQAEIFSVSTGRRRTVPVSVVCGSAGLAYPQTLLSGGSELSRGGNFCLLSGELSDRLFGSTDTAGETVLLGEDAFVVEGVIDLEGEWLIRPAADGEEFLLDGAAFSVARRWQARERAENCLAGAD